jgi:hypothetical protein
MRFYTHITLNLRKIAPNLQAPMEMPIFVQLLEVYL